MLLNYVYNIPARLPEIISHVFIDKLCIVLSRYRYALWCTSRMHSYDHRHRINVLVITYANYKAICYHIKPRENHSKFNSSVRLEI